MFVTGWQKFLNQIISIFLRKTLSRYSEQKGEIMSTASQFDFLPDLNDVSELYSLRMLKIENNNKNNRKPKQKRKVLCIGRYNFTRKT